jgi:CheY-specific phosphatase CheX
LLHRATATTFESLAFLFAEEDCTEEQLAAPLDAQVSVDFHGPMRGRLVLRISSLLMPAIASNMVGDEESHVAALQRDALGEVCNVICGNLLPAIAGADAVFLLDAPAWRDDSDDSTAQAPICRVMMGVEEGRAETSLVVFAGHELLAGAPVPAGIA